MLKKSIFIYILMCICILFTSCGGNKYVQLGEKIYAAKLRDGDLYKYVSNHGDEIVCQNVKDNIIKNHYKVTLEGLSMDILVNSSSCKVKFEDGRQINADFKEGVIKKISTKSKSGINTGDYEIINFVISLDNSIRSLEFYQRKIYNYLFIVFILIVFIYLFYIYNRNLFLRKNYNEILNKFIKCLLVSIVVIIIILCYF